MKRRTLLQATIVAPTALSAKPLGRGVHHGHRVVPMAITRDAFDYVCADCQEIFSISMEYLAAHTPVGGRVGDTLQNHPQLRGAIVALPPLPKFDKHVWRIA